VEQLRPAVITHWTLEPPPLATKVSGDTNQDQHLLKGLHSKLCESACGLYLHLEADGAWIHTRGRRGDYREASERLPTLEEIG
jgi:hypothetical protein